MSRSPLAALALLLMLAAGRVAADTLVVDGSCTLGDAIEAANTDLTMVGGCVDVQTGADTIVLDVDTVLSSADTLRSTLLGGAYAGLPDVTSEITILAGSASRIERDPALACEVPDPADEFRLLNVNGGTLNLDGLTLANGCADDGGARQPARISPQDDCFVPDEEILKRVGKNKQQHAPAA